MRYILTLVLVFVASLGIKAQNKDAVTSVFKFYSNDNCVIYKDGKIVCALVGNSDEPYILSVSRKGDYRFKVVNASTNETKIINQRIDADEEINVDIEWDKQQTAEVAEQVEPKEEKVQKPVVKQDAQSVAVPDAVPVTAATVATVPAAVPVSQVSQVAQVPVSEAKTTKVEDETVVPRPESTVGQTVLADSAYYKNMEITTISLPASLREIGLHTVDHCFNLTEINVEAANPKFKSVNGVVYSKDGTVLILCPPGKEGEFVIPSTVSSIAPYAFSSCKKITSIVLPEGLAEIPDGAFYKCWGLLKINLPEGLKRIGKNAFDGTIVQKMNMPTSMELIDDEAFINTSIVEVNLRVTTPFELGENVFGEIHVTRLNVPSAGLNNFKKHPKWGKFGRITPTHSYWTVDLP